MELLPCAGSAVSRKSRSASERDRRGYHSYRTVLHALGRAFSKAGRRNGRFGIAGSKACPSPQHDKGHFVTANRELDQLLQTRVDDVYRQIMFDLGTAALLWLLALALILLIARQITGPLSELAAVTERVRFGDDDMARAERPAGGGSTLIRGFNSMLDYCSGKRNGSKSASPETVRLPPSSSFLRQCRLSFRL